MCHDDQSFARMRARELMERSSHPRADLAARFAASGTLLGILGLESQQARCVERLDLAARESRPAADVELAKTRVGARREPERAADDLGRRARPLQIAAQQAIGALRRDRTRDRFGL